MFIYFCTLLGLSYCIRSQFQHVGSFIVACGIQFPDRGSNPGPLLSGCRGLATGPLGKSLFCAALWRYSLYTIKFTCVKCIVQWFSVCSQSCKHHHYLVSLKYFHHLKKKPHTHQQSLPISQTLQHLATVIYFLFPWICLFQIFHVN